LCVYVIAAPRIKNSRLRLLLGSLNYALILLVLDNSRLMRLTLVVKRAVVVEIAVVAIAVTIAVADSMQEQEQYDTFFSFYLIPQYVCIILGAYIVKCNQIKMK